MNVLILGGTQFVGRHIAEALLAAGHRVTIFTRGKTADSLPAQVERLHGDRNDGISALEILNGRSWHASVDVSGYTPKQVRPSAELLRDSVNRYVFISTMSVYAESPLRPFRETHPLRPPADEDVTKVTGETYGPLKVACENIIQQIYQDRSTLLRPQIVAGPHDHTGRYTHWVKRAMESGEMLAPGDGTDHLQVIDARDLARFTVRVVEKNIGGVFNLAGPRITWAEFTKVLGAKNVKWLAPEAMKSSGAEMPLFIPDGSPSSGLMDVSSEHAVAAGLVLSDPAVTVRDVRAWIAEQK